MYAWVLVVAVFNNSPPLVVPGIADQGACVALHDKLAAARYVPARQWHGPVGSVPTYCFQYEIAPTK
jgi:hypothetical protein